EHATRIGVYAHMRYPAMPEVTQRRIANMFLPYYGGQPWHDAITPEWDPDTARVGSVVLALAMASLVLAPRRRETWFFFTLAVLCACAGAEALPISRMLHALPLFDIALNHRFVYAAAFFLTVLAAIAVDSIPSPADAGEGGAKRRVRVRTAAALILLIAVILGVASAIVSPGQMRFG